MRIMRDTRELDCFMTSGVLYRILKTYSICTLPFDDNRLNKRIVPELIGFGLAFSATSRIGGLIPNNYQC
jgi:hypothetical protein